MIVAALPLVLVAVLGGGIALNEAGQSTEPTETVQVVDQVQVDAVEAAQVDSAE